MAVLFIMAGFILQFRWMQHATSRNSEDIVLPAFARRISAWMLHKRGISDEQAMTGSGGPEKVPCEHCLGSGMVYGDEGEASMCPICQGVGYRMVRRLDPADRICPACGGMGRVVFFDSGQAGTCPRCDGRGLTRSAAAPAAVP